MTTHLDKLRHLCQTVMHSKGMPSLVINAPEDSDDQWYIYPAGQAALGYGATLEAAIDDAMSHPQVPAMPPEPPAPASTMDGRCVHCGDLRSKHPCPGPQQPFE